MTKSIFNQPVLGSVAGSPFAEPYDLHLVKERVHRASGFLKALSNEKRLLLLCLMSDRERSVTELETLLALRQPTVSQQLARLRNEGLVAPRRDGKVIYYSISSEEVRRMIGVLYELFWREAMEGRRDVSKPS
jgi:DNA-binding transcriptional ArsR family regulator